MEVRDHTVLVTGGSSGLGQACVHRLAAAGAKVLFVDLKPPADPLPDATTPPLFVQADVTREDEVRAAIEQGVGQFGPLAAAITCAGVVHSERVLGKAGPASLENFRRVVEVNLIGTFNTARLAAEAIALREPDEEGERGAIVMTASIAAMDGQIGQAAYAASKGGVASATLPMARDLSRQGIRVVAIAPGVFETPMMQAVPDAFREALVEQTPFPKRFGQPGEFAALAQHALENRMLNGSVIRLDAALRMPPK